MKQIACGSAVRPDERWPLPRSSNELRGQRLQRGLLAHFKIAAGSSQVQPRLGDRARE